MCVLILLFLTSLSVNAYELIAHRGVHQTYHREGLTHETCTAIRIEKTGHTYLENTIESIEKAFKLGATMVELDVHRTTEESGFDELVVFHDWALDCRTNASCDDGCKCIESKECITNEQSWSYLKTLDLGHGHTFDGGESYPFRAQYFGLMPLFEDVLKLLDKYDSKKILVNVKGNKKRTAQAFLRIIEKYPLSTKKRLYYPYKYGFQEELKEMGVEDQIVQGDRACLTNYLKTGWYGNFPKECHNKKIFIPIRESLERVLGKPGRYLKFISILWGWPDKFINLAHKHGTKVYASQVDSVEEYREMIKLDLDGLMTNKVELIAPLIHKD